MDAKERLRRVRALRETLPANGEAQPPVAARRRSPAPAPPAYDSSEERSAFDADSTSDESSDELPPPWSDAKASAGAAAVAEDDRAPPPTYEAADRVTVLRAVFERSLGLRPGHVNEKDATPQKTRAWPRGVYEGGSEGRPPPAPPRTERSASATSAATLAPIK